MLEQKKNNHFIGSHSSLITPPLKAHVKGQKEKKISPQLSLKN